MSAALSLRLPWTRIKLFVAGVLYRFLRFFLRGDARIVSRGGIRYKLDLSEAIDFSLFVAGGFQPYVFKNRYLRLPPGAVIFDVGANVGSMTLAFARQVPEGRVYAFEPTHGAHGRLLENLALNPLLAARVVPIQAFVSDVSAEKHALTAFSSWKIDGSSEGAHPLHGGLLQPAEGVPAFSLDDFVRSRGIDRLDLLKIDTEGHELAVLRGARGTLERFHPPVIFELGLYTLEERGLTLAEYFDVLTPLGYRWIDLKTGRTVTPANAGEEIPRRSTTDILAVPAERGA